MFDQIIDKPVHRTNRAVRAHQTVKVGYLAPDFTMKTTADIERLETTISLIDYRRRWLVLFFYPMDFTFVCPTEVIAFSERYKEFVTLGAEVLGVSTDSVYTHRAWIQAPRSQNGLGGSLRYPLASDITKEVSRAYGVLDEYEGIALRGLFIIDPQGVLQYSVIHNLDVGRSLEETLRMLEALQTGELCPANWRSGQPTL